MKVSIPLSNEDWDKLIKYNRDHLVYTVKCIQLGRRKRRLSEIIIIVEEDDESRTE